MLFVSVFDNASKPDRTSLQPHPSPTKNRHAPQQTGLRPDHCATQPHSTLFVSNQQVFRAARKCVPMLGALADFPSCPPPGQRSSQCECFTLCLLSTAGLVRSRKLLSSSSSTFELAVRMTGVLNGRRSASPKDPSPRHIGRREDDHRGEHTPEWLSLRSDEWVCALCECCRPNFVDKVAMPGMWREAHSSTAGCSRVPQIPAGERDRRTALSSERTFSADGSRGQDEDQGAGADAQVSSLTPGRRVGSEDHGCTSTRSKSKQRSTPSWRVPGQRAGWTRMGQDFAPSRSPGDGNSTGQGCCHPNPAPRSRKRPRSL